MQLFGSDFHYALHLKEVFLFAPQFAVRSHAPTLVEPVTFIVRVLHMRAHRIKRIPRLGNTRLLLGRVRDVTEVLGVGSDVFVCVCVFFVDFAEVPVGN